ncbi:SDR family oxidoreductase [Chiayiivirga flava]|uniref:Short-subunit dehydrogenase n=1 Tax=Chiayiivirga flava TaxID=659595 RepID=A0A7W8FZD4_9GAMM|nr:SDR family oxidoreductase [Chiayiivirga flava]MBB5206528.1 short-subunit dehydrogenase [Chiayiivirga flava]
MALGGQLILLTGASGGIGRAIAQRLAARGAQLVLVGRAVDRLEGVRDILPGNHGIVPADIATAAGRARVAAAVDALGRPLDALINNAGVSRFTLLPDAAPADIEAQIATNVTAPILLTQLVLPRLHRVNGRIVNIGSSFGGIGHPGFSTYCASKFALRGFTEALRRELGDGAMQVAYLAPRATRTPLNDSAVDAMNAALGNAVDPPERVAAAVEAMLLAPVMRDRAIGWPERLFLRINAVFPALVDGALRKRLAAIKRFAAPAPNSP